ncbi:MAG: hypothetical protein K9M82_12400 [Deltaproteobacteria bacterium]|nr:hypothetical protein [Deltaproteobacteria bacterium]
MKDCVMWSLLVSMFVTSFLIGGSVFAGQSSPPDRRIAPIVSTTWLQENAELKSLVILDIRSEAEYAAAHIPGARNAPFEMPVSAWTALRDELLLEVPEKDQLFDTLGKLGIRKDSQVVIVTAPVPGQPPHYGLADATRVADTLIYAGVKDVAVLDGGHPKWVADRLPTTGDVPGWSPTSFQGEVREEMFVSTAYVHDHLCKAGIVDARDPDVYFGVTLEPFAGKPGHIPTAVSLPAPWIWDANEDGTYTYKDVKTLEAMASSVTRGCKDPECREIIVYCGVGGYASSWWFVLTQVLGYENVSFYDGAAQAWVREHDMVPFQWE